ncbi:uncharacterized protein [Henckelia pumila]|uniref:uncharacterized protein n=1 Tax=Henckelia pumila TaxID=405737 RepID=UPI003C6DDD29
MGRKSSIFSDKRLLFESSICKAVDNMTSNSTSQASASKVKKGSEDASNLSKKRKERDFNSESASKGKNRSEDASEPTKKRKERNSKSNRVLSDDASSMPIDYMHTKQLAQAFLVQ